LTYELEEGGAAAIGDGGCDETLALFKICLKIRKSNAAPSGCPMWFKVTAVPPAPAAPDIDDEDDDDAVRTNHRIGHEAYRS